MKYEKLIETFEFMKRQSYQGVQGYICLDSGKEGYCFWRNSTYSR